VEVGKHVRVNKGHSEFPMASGEMDDKEFEGFLDRFIAGCLPLLSTEALLYIFMDWRHLTHLTSAASNNKLIQQNLCIWAKTNGGMGSFYRSQHELIGVFSRSTQFQTISSLVNLGAIEQISGPTQVLTPLAPRAQKTWQIIQPSNQPS
jgi:hypothetical protein